MSDKEMIQESQKEDEEEFIGMEEEENDYMLMIQIQEMLTSLSEENFESSMAFFTKTQIYQSPDLQLLLTDEIISAFSVRPGSKKVYARFCCELKKNGIFEEIFLSEFFRPEPDSRYIDAVITRSALLRECILQGFTQIDVIQNYIVSFACNYSDKLEQLFVIVMYLAPELEASMGDSFNAFIKIFDIFNVKCRSPQIFSVYKDIEAMRADNWRKLHECIEFGAPLGSVQAAIKKDDVEMLKATKFSVNARIDKAPFEIHPAAQRSLLVLQYAALFGAEKCVDYIISKHPMILSDDSVSSFQYERTEAIYDGKDSPDYERSVAYGLALVGHNPNIISKFHELHFATNSTHLFSAAYRLNYGYKQDCATDDLFEAAKYNNIQCVLNCIDMSNIKDGRENNMTPAHVAASRGHSYVLQMIYSRLENQREEEGDGNLCPLDLFGRKPIHIAAIEGHFDIVQVLLTFGCNPDQPDNFGETCISLAAKYGHPAIVNFLLQEGANPNPKDHNSMTPLLLAAAEGRVDVCDILANNENVDVNATCEFGVNALHLAVQNGHFNTFKVLMDSGRFDINSKDFIGRTVFDITPNEEVLEEIKKYKTK